MSADRSSTAASRRPTRWPFNTLFGRMAVFATLVLFAVQAGWFAVLAIQRPRHVTDGYARGLALVVQSVRPAAEKGGAIPPELRAELRLSAAPSTATVFLKDTGGHEGPMASLRQALRDRLPVGTDVRITASEPYHLWVRYPSSQSWIVVALDPPRTPPVLLESIAMLLAAVLLSLGAAWQMQRPLARVAQVAQRFGKGERPLPVEEEGPREIRELIHSVNQMMLMISQGEDERSLMLAGIAHDLKAPLTRMKLRASVLEDDIDRAQFTRDADSLTHIVQQFLEFAGSEPDDGADVSVDVFLAEQFAMPITPLTPLTSATSPPLVGGESALFEHHLEAGLEFVLPRTLLDRLMTNLVDNALDHGEPPVQIRTRREADEWVLEVRDHGVGIPPDRIVEAAKPFARLDSARSGDGHCGLGLAIVARLARKRRGRCDISNAPGGGLAVKIILPVVVAASAGAPTPRQ